MDKSEIQFFAFAQLISNANASSAMLFHTSLTAVSDIRCFVVAVQVAIVACLVSTSAMVADIHKAARKGNLSKVQALIAGGADLSKLDKAVDSNDAWSDMKPTRTRRFYFDATSRSYGCGRLNSLSLRYW